MKEILDNDINNIDEIQMNTLDDMGIGFGNSLYKHSNKDVELLTSSSEEKASTEVEKVIEEITKSEDLVYSNLEKVITTNNMYKNLETEDTIDDSVAVSHEADIAKIDVNNDTNSDINKDIDKDNTNEMLSSTEDKKHASLNDKEDIEDKVYSELSDISKMLQDSVAEVEKSMDIDAATEKSVLKEKSVLNSESNDLENNEVLEDKIIIDGDVENRTSVIGYKFVDVEEAANKGVSGRIEEVTNKDVDFISDDIAPYISKVESSEKSNKKYNGSDRSKMYKKMALIAAVFAIVGSSIFLGIRGLASKINFTDFSDTVEQEEQFDTESVLSDNAEVVKVNEFNWDMIKGDPTYDENIYNILIIGGDIAGTRDARGNSDTLIIVSIDKNTKSIKLSSIMRDTYVPIPGYSDNKINSAYATGGVPLVKQVIEENFKVTIDSTVVVNYTTFVKAIQKLGGVKGVVLNGAEARFINRECNKHGHSSNLVEGTYDLDAYQALHFARIRKISSDVYGKDDFGRTARQRYVINQLFKQYKDLNYAQLAGVLTSVMGELQVDEVLKKDLFLLAQVALKFDAETLGEFRLPMDDAYSFASVPLPGTGQNMSVVKIDDYWQTNVDALHEFIYGTTEY